MGHEGMRASLVSREVIADSVETVMHAERLDGMVTFAGCDKSLPGMLMAAARLDLPAVFLYGGSILPGHHNGAATRHHPGRVRGRRRACAAGTIDDGARRHRAQRLPHRGRVRRHVHRQHDGVGGSRRSACRCPARPRRRRSTAAATTRLPLRRGRGACSAGHPPPRHHHQGGVRERHRRRHGARRLHQRGAAPARHRPRGRGRPAPRRLQPHRRRVPHIADTKPHGKYT
jgi:hypothetical protein